jgi:hypothetical protein
VYVLILRVNIFLSQGSHRVIILRKNRLIALQGRVLLSLGRPAESAVVLREVLRTEEVILSCRNKGLTYGNLSFF